MEKEYQQQFEELFSRYGPLINKVCYFYADDVDDFNDLRQEGLLNLWRSLGKYRNECSPMTWTYRVILNSCVSYVRKNMKFHAEPIENHPELISGDSDKSLMISELYDLINNLGKIDKALVLLWLDGTDYETIAQIMGMNKTTVGSRLHRCKNKLMNLSNK